jgi:hypothetical protein
MAKTTKITASQADTKTEDVNRPGFAFGKENYILGLIGVGLIILGFVLMTGGGSKDPNVFNMEMFDFRRITLSPILILVGFAVEIVAIMKRPKD